MISFLKKSKQNNRKLILQKNNIIRYKKELNKKLKCKFEYILFL